MGYSSDKASVTNSVFLTSDIRVHDIVEIINSTFMTSDIGVYSSLISNIKLYDNIKRS